MPGGLTGAGMGMGRLQGSLGGGTVLLVSNLEEEVRTGAVRDVLGSPVFAVPSESCLRFRPGSLPAAPSLSAAAHRQQSLLKVSQIPAGRHQKFEILELPLLVPPPADAGNGDPQRSSGF